MIRRLSPEHTCHTGQLLHAMELAGCLSFVSYGPGLGLNRLEFKSHEEAERHMKSKIRFGRVIGRFAFCGSWTQREAERAMP